MGWNIIEMILARNFSILVTCVIHVTFSIGSQKWNMAVNWYRTQNLAATSVISLSSYLSQILPFFKEYSKAQIIVLSPKEKLSLIVVTQSSRASETSWTDYQSTKFNDTKE